MSRAASEMGVTHGAVSHQVRSLERTLGVKLFVRDGNTLLLSPHGSALLPSITHAFGSITEAVSLLTAPNTAGELVISCLPSLLAFWILPRLNRFSERHPNVHLKLISSNDKRRVYAQDVDIWITFGREAWPDRDCELWLEPSLFPVCSPALINSKPLRKAEDLRNHTLLHAYDGREWNDWLNAAGVPELACGARHTMSDAHMATLAATYGHGIALCDSLTVRDLLSEGRLVIPIDLKIPSPEPFYIVYRHELRRAPIVRAFIDWVFNETAPQRSFAAFQNAVVPPAIRRKTQANKLRRRVKA